jgi:hypothetical protein
MVIPLPVSTGDRSRTFRVRESRHQQGGADERERRMFHM